MMKTKHARTVVRLDIENTIAPRSKISPPTSFAVSVEMRVIWLGIVPIGKRVQAGVTMVLALLLLVASAAEMALTVNTR